MPDHCELPAQQHTAWLCSALVLRRVVRHRREDLQASRLRKGRHRREEHQGMTRRQSRLLATTTLAATLLWLLIAPAQTSMELAGTRTLVDDEIEVVYQAPESTPRGVLLILHGCSHRATDSWPKSDACPECTGLPIETRVVAAALARNWAVAAVTSHNRRSGCWSQRDIDRIAKATGYVRRVTNAGPATVSLGASSGGSIAVLVPGAVACVAQIMASPLELDARHPPTRFVHMSRDTHRAAMIQHQVAALRERGVDAAELIVEPEPLSADALFRRGAGPGGAVLPSREMAERAFSALRDGGFVDASGFLVDDPRRTNWRDAVRPVVPEAVDSLVADASPVSEILNVAWARHEFTDAHLEESLDWLGEKASSAASRGELA